MSPPLHHESWFSHHLRAGAWLRSQFPAFARHAWRRWRAYVLLLAALLAGAAAVWLWRLGPPTAPQKPPALPALSPIPDLTPARELPPGASGAPPLPSTLTPAQPPAAPPLQEQAPPAHRKR
jgi:hypothetical protein